METLNETMYIAKTILNQIKSLDRLFLMAVGANNYAALSINGERAGGIEFKVNGLAHRGWCKIELTYLDTYRILFINKKRETVKVVEECYCDQLVEILEFVEGH
ncbi:MAG: hypothetical protein COA32_01530 [Fluviicola sp.]|nr:MAG: hypothetical protein COA32_01530 [Fluviicola sp.]